MTNWKYFQFTQNFQFVINFQFTQYNRTNIKHYFSATMSIQYGPYSTSPPPSNVWVKFWVFRISTILVKSNSLKTPIKLISRSDQYFLLISRDLRLTVKYLEYWNWFTVYYKYSASRVLGSPQPPCSRNDVGSPPYMWNWCHHKPTEIYEN